MQTDVKRHPNFKGGKIYPPSGYVMIFVGVAHHLADCRGYAYEHRINAEKKLGRRLKKGEFVHHVNGIKNDNGEDNLEVYPSSAHHFEHHRRLNDGKKLPDEVNESIPCACGCGESFLKFDKSNRPRKFVRGHNMSK
jgi:hypothetical protein